MLAITKIFRFETAHALHGYEGPCRNIHGHTYTLHVTIGAEDFKEQYIPSPGILFDFKDLKKIVQEEVVSRYDHAILLSASFLEVNPHLKGLENLRVLDFEPSAENMLLDIRNSIAPKLPPHVHLIRLKLFETADSYAELTGLTRPEGAGLNGPY